MLVRKNLWAILALMAATSVLAGCGGAAGREAAYLKRGKAFLAKQDYPKAEVELKNVLQIDPKNAMAYYLLGETEQKLSNLQLAFGYYSKAVALQPDFPAAQAKVGTFYLLSGDVAKASQTADTLLAKHPSDARGQLLKAAVMARLGNMAGAIKEASNALAADPSNSRAASLLALLYVKHGETAKGASVLQNAIAKNPKSIPLRLTLIRLYATNPENNDKIQQLFREIIAIAPEQLQPRVMYASFLVHINQTKQAEQVLRDAVQEKPKDVRRHVILAQFLADSGNVAAAKAELQNTARSHPDSDSPRFALGALYAQTHDFAKAETNYRQIISSDNTTQDVLQARDRLAALLLQQGKVEESMEQVKKVLDKDPQDSGALLLQGTNALSHGDALTALTAFRSLLKNEPTSAKILALLAQANLMNHAPDLARANLARAVSDNPNDINARLRLARFLMQENDSGAALKQVHQALMVAPDNAAALELEADIMVARHDQGAAAGALEQLSNAYPKDPIGPYRLGQLYGSQKHYNQAAAQFELALERAPQASQVLAALIDTYLARGASMKAVARLQKQIHMDPNDAPAHELLGEVYMHLKKYADAGTELRRALTIAPKWNIPYVNLAQVDRLRGDDSGALAVYQQGLKSIPGDQHLLLALASYYESRHEDQKATATYRSAIQADPKDAVAANNLAMLLVERGGATRLKEAQTLATRLASSPIPAFLDTAGWVSLKSGNTDQAIALLSKAVDAQPQVPIFQYHLGLAYRQKGEIADARMHLAKAAAATHFDKAAEARTMLESLH